MRVSSRRHAGRAPRRASAFTLVELMVVIAIIALLVSILVPSLAEVKELARRTICQTNLHALGRGWELYFNQSNGRTPNMFNDRKGVTDCISQFNFIFWTCTDGGWCNAGVLYDGGYVQSEKSFVCPTVQANTPGTWFNSDNIIHQVCWGFWKNNPWPPVDWGGHHVFMTYGTRRMLAYDDPSLAVQNNHLDPRDDHIMIWSAGVNGVTHPPQFSFMADCFTMPEIATLAHVPGVNVLYLDGHVGHFVDETGEVLYDNGITGWGIEYNWEHDQVWMEIDERD